MVGFIPQETRGARGRAHYLLWLNSPTESRAVPTGLSLIDGATEFRIAIN